MYTHLDVPTFSLLAMLTIVLSVISFPDILGRSSWKSPANDNLLLIIQIGQITYACNFFLLAS